MGSIFRQRATLLRTICVVVNYWVVSITMVFLNKHLVGRGESEYDLSIFVAWVQNIGCALFVMLFTQAGHNIDSRMKPVGPDLRISNSQLMLMLSCLYVGMLSFNNLCLKYVGVAFFQLARSLTLIFTVLFSAAILGKRSSAPCIVCCALVVVGFVLGVDQEKLAGTLSTIGVTYGILSSIFVSLVGILSKKALDAVAQDPIKLTYIKSFNASFLFLPVAMVAGQMDALVASGNIWNVGYLGALLLSGVMNFLIAYATNLQIHHTSPLTHIVSTNFKSVMQTVLAVVVFRESKPTLWWLGNGLVMLGALAYAIVKTYEGQTKEKLPLTVDKNLNNVYELQERRPSRSRIL